MPTTPFVKTAFLLLIGATVFWGLNFHLAKIMLEHVAFIEAGFWRYFIGVGILFFMTFQSLRKLKMTEVRKGLKGLLLVGFIGLFGFNFFFFLGLRFTSALNASLIVSLNPASTLLMSYLILKTPISRQQKIGMCIALLGVIYLLVKGEFQQLLHLKLSKGDLLILIGNLIFAVQNVWVKIYGSQFSNLVFTALTNALCLLGFLLLLPFMGLETPPLKQYDFWLSALGIGFLGTSLAYLFWNKGIMEIGAANAGLFMNIVPLAAALFAILFGEKLEYYHLFSGVLILLGVFYVQKK